MSTTSILNNVLSATTGSSTTGIDVTDAVNAILYADRAPERAYQAQQATLATQSAAINQLQNESSTLTNQLYALQDVTGALNSVDVTSSDTSLVSATAAPGTVIGNHTVEVDSLATTGLAYSDEVATSSTQLSSGSFTITAGSGGASTTIQVGQDSTNSTLDELAATINGQSLGVTASVVTDSSGARLSLTALSSGAAAGFTISQVSGLNFTQPATGADASLAVDGVPITSASNIVTGAISGLTLNLLGASPGNSNTPATVVNLTLAPDTASIETAVSNFVSAYNTLITDVNSQFAYDSGTQTAGTLSTDSSIQGFQSDLLGATNYTSGSGVNLQDLSSLGVSTNADGTLTLDTAALSNAVTSNSSAVQTFFQGTNANGFVASLESSLNTYTDPTQGAFTVDLTSISSENTALTNQIGTIEAYLATQQTALTTEYNNADIALSQLPQTLKEINALLNPTETSDNS